MEGVYSIGGRRVPSPNPPASRVEAFRRFVARRTAQLRKVLAGRKTLVASVGPGRPFSPMPLAKHSYFAELTFVRTRSHASDWAPDISRHPRKTGTPRDHLSGLGSILTDQRSWSSTSLSVTVMTSVGPSIATCPKN